MMNVIYYNRKATIDYAKKWAFSRNPKFYNFDLLGGDCTNFASQCIFAGSNVMNYTPIYGWYYINASSRTASWTGVQYLYNFLVTNKRQGPFGYQVDKNDLEVGDIVQLGNYLGVFYHSPVVTKIINNEIFVAAHTNNVYDYPLYKYNYNKIRYIHIDAVRK
jgi:hypothetical protein